MTSSDMYSAPLYYFTLDLNIMFIIVFINQARATRLPQYPRGFCVVACVCIHVYIRVCVCVCWCAHVLSLPQELGSMRSLTCLDVSENKLEHLPEEMGNLLSLTDLLVSQNLIDMLPESLGQCSGPDYQLQCLCVCLCVLQFDCCPW